MLADSLLLGAMAGGCANEAPRRTMGDGIAARANADLCHFALAVQLCLPSSKIAYFLIQHPQRQDKERKGGGGGGDECQRTLLHHGMGTDPT